MSWSAIRNWLAGLLPTSEHWGRYLAAAVHIIAILVGAFLSYQVLRWLLFRAFAHRTRLITDGRRATIGPLTSSVLKYIIGAVALVMILHELGINYTAILAGAGVVGLTIGLGAQTLIRDFLAGFFLLFEDLIEVGDFIEVGDKSGTVEQIGLRVTQFRSFNGALHTIPNGELGRFANYNRDFCRAIVDVDISYRHDARDVIARADAVAQAWAAENPEQVLEPPQVLGIMQFGDSGVSIKVTAKVKPKTHWQAERELRCRLKEAFDQAGIEIPFPQRDVHLRQPAPGDSPPARTGTRPGRSG